MLAEIGDITRFPSARTLASWAGLTPTVRGSGRTARHEHISKQGSAWLRWVLNQAAQTAKRSPEFAAAYATIAKRRGTKIATIAISRKLLTRAWHLLATQASTRPSARHPPPRRPRRPGGSPGPGHARSRGMSRPAAALDHLTEQPGPRTHGHGGRAPARCRMGACETTRPATPGASTTLKDPSTKDLPRFS
jgi:Transposase IS116/IS110/IS902 family